MIFRLFNERNILLMFSWTFCNVYFLLFFNLQVNRGIATNNRRNRREWFMSRNHERWNGKVRISYCFHIDEHISYLSVWDEGSEFTIISFVRIGNLFRWNSTYERCIEYVFFGNLRTQEVRFFFKFKLINYFIIHL